MKTGKQITQREKLCESLIRRIQNEEWAHGTRLPSFDALRREYKVSLITVIGAVRLAEER